ncbi:MAG: adenylate/guanylate cyclase domain-containing protein, partial [Phycisphaerae bacterium]|nr:adenylate/guanylate cyclase domain-containing protein [Phycisphaerae bacterium]
MKALRSLNRPALAASLLVTITAVILESAGVFDRLEGASLTMRFQVARSRPQPLDPSIALVAIDDSSEETFGRWPWARSIQAKAIDEIERAGAHVVVFDVLYNEPSDDSAQDEALAAAIGRCEGVVAANVDAEQPIDESWLGPQGRHQLERVLEALGSSIELSDDQVIERAGLSEPWASRFQAQPIAFRKLAAWSRVQDLREQGRAPETLEQLFEAIGLAKTLVEGTSPERKMLERLWQRESAWQALSRFMPPATERPAPKEAPPILAIARSAGGAGMVYGPADPGGQTRRVKPFVATPGGDCLQLGIAGAAKFLGVDPRAVRLDGGRVVVGDRSIPLHDGKIVIDWPTATFDKFSTLRGGGAKCVAVPIGTLADLADQRLVQARQEAAYVEEAVKLAHNYARPESVLRTLPLPEEFRSDLIESIEWQFPGVLERGLDALPPETDEATRGAAKLVVNWVSLEQAVLKGRETLRRLEEQARSELGGKLVIVGYVATAQIADMINTPYGPRTPGCFVHAAVANMVLHGKGMQFTPWWIGPAATLVLGALCGVIAAVMGAGRGSLLALLALVAYLAAVLFVFGSWSIVAPMAAPLLGGFGSWVAGVTLVAVISQRERARVTRQFRARVSPQLVERLAANPGALSVGGLEREVTILFGDLAGFTTLSEQLGGAEVVSTLNRYMGAMTRQLTARRGYVNKFLGDGLLAFWSAFEVEPDQRRLAAEAALACQDAVTTLGDDPEFRDRPPIRLRLGIATGDVVVGDCGAPPELNDYTVIGDAVNLASRLESANKQFGTRILMDGNTAAGVSNAAGAPRLLALGPVIVVGQSVPVELFTVLNGKEPEGWEQAISGAVARFRAGDRAAALE